MCEAPFGPTGTISSVTPAGVFLKSSLNPIQFFTERNNQPGDICFPKRGVEPTIQKETNGFD